MHCPQCKRRTRTAKSVDFTAFRGYVCFHLLRFEHGRKLTRRAAFDTLMTVQLAVSGEAVNLELVAVVRHEGGYGAGHYVTHAKLHETWALCDGGTMQTQTRAQVCSAQAYLLLYRVL